MDGKTSQDNLGLKILKNINKNNLINSKIKNTEYSIKYDVEYGIAVSHAAV